MVAVIAAENALRAIARPLLDRNAALGDDALRHRVRITRGERARRRRWQGGSGRRIAGRNVRQRIEAAAGHEQEREKCFPHAARIGPSA